MSGKLYLVGTPIGNLGDLSPRAAEVLSGADFIAAEDTRVTMKLLSHLGIKKELVSYYEHNRAESGPRILSRIEAGETCALVTDAGMPAISDPGEDLVREARSRGIEVLAVPGPTAVTTALALSGLPTGRFTFEGFLSVNRKSRFEHLDSLRSERRTMVFYEAPHKLLRTLEDMLEVLGDRPIALCREITKLHEETELTTIQKALEHYRETAPRGEYVLVVGGAGEEEAPAATLPEAVKLARELMESGMSLRDASKRASQRTGVSKNAIYDALLLSGED